MKKRKMLLYGMLAVVCLVCSAVVVTYAMGNMETTGATVVNPDRAVLCTVAAVVIGVGAMIKRHYRKAK